MKIKLSSKDTIFWDFSYSEALPFLERNIFFEGLNGFNNDRLTGVVHKVISKETAHSWFRASTSDFFIPTTFVG